MLKRLQKSFFPVVLILIIGLLVWKNYVPGTWLSGWDTLHPEFNLSVYLRRAFSGAWQEHQGLGVAASQAHAAEIPRLLLISLLTLILPLSAVRYVFFFLALVVGALGFYYFVRYLLAKRKLHFVDSASFLAALFYVFNLTTLQHFYVPLEMFAVHFATLPWLFFLVVLYLREGKRKHLIWFSLVTLMAAGMAHTATLFYAYLGGLAVFLITLILLILRRSFIKKGAIVIILTLMLNSFWLLPNVYYIINHSEEVSQSKIHRIFSDEAFLQSKSFGDVRSLALSKNFLFNWREFDFDKSEFVDLMDEWQEHLDKPGVEIVGYTLFAFAVLGVVVALFSGSRYAVSLLPLLLISFFFWINSNPPFIGLFDYLRGNISLFREALRFPFTKFSILLIFTLATYFAYFIQFILEKLKAFKFSVGFFLLAFAAIIYFSLPAFDGYFISPSMKVEIPDNYFEVFDWFSEKDPAVRIAKLPLQTHWGWNFYTWDYQGAGFTWFGIPQPTLDREFDRWSPYNESFYNEAAFALYAKDNEAFERVLEKYRVGYLLLDESILNAGGSEEILYIPEIKEMFNESLHVREIKKFGFLTIYETDFVKAVNFVSAPKTAVKADVDLTYSQIDPIYSKYRTYIQDEEGVAYPFVNFDKRGEVEVSVEDQKITFLNAAKNAKVVLPIENSTIESFGPRRGFAEVYNCDLKKIGSVEKKKLEDGVYYFAEGGGVSCDFYSYPDISYSQGYVLRIKGENKEGRSLKIYLQNIETKRMDLEELLPKGLFDETFFILPKGIDGGGYTLNVETRSFGRVASENVLETIEFYPVPIDWLTSLYSDMGKDIYFENKLEILNVNKLGASHYLVDTKGEGLVMLGQGYEEGWRAYTVDGKQLAVNSLPHVKINSWANGWFVPEGQQRIVIVYWPQYLQYLGVLLGLISLAWIIFKKNDLIVDRRKGIKIKYS